MIEKIQKELHIGDEYDDQQFEPEEEPEESVEDKKPKYDFVDNQFHNDGPLNRSL